jgi:hypothetical protein
MAAQDPGDLFTSIDAAAKDFGKYYNGKSIINNQEYRSEIYTVKDATNGKTYYSYTPSNDNNGETSSAATPIPDGTTKVADVHSHSADDPGAPPKESPDQFSDVDKNLYNNKELNPNKDPGYVAIPNGSLLKYDPKTGQTSTVSTDLPSDPQSPSRKNDISPLSGKSEQATLNGAMKPVVAKQDAIPAMIPPPPPPKQNNSKQQ